MLKGLKYFFGAIKKIINDLLVRCFRLPKFLRPIEKKLVVILLITIVIFSFAAIIDNGGNKPTYGGTYIQGFIGEPKYINPILAVTDIDTSLSKFIYSGLTKINSKGEPVGDLAASWQVGADAKSYTFTLNPDIYWHDNNKLTSKDIVYTYDLIKDPAISSPLYTYWKDIQVDAVDEKTISFKLKDYSPSFLWQSTVGIVPEHVGRANLSKSFVGSGPYKYSKVKVKSGIIESVILTRNSRWYNSQPPFIDTVEAWFYSDRDSALKALKSQKIHAIDGNGVNEPWLAQYTLTLHQSSMLFLNSQSDLFNDGTKRNEFLNGSGPITANEINVIADNITAQDSQFLEKKAGWEVRGAKIRITQDSIDQIQKELLSKRQYDIMAVGVDSSVYSDRYPYWHSSQVGGAGLNFSRYKNTDLDKLVNDQHKSVSIVEEQQLAQQIDSYVQSQFLVKELSKKLIIYDIARNIHISEVKEGVSAANRFDNFNLWYIKTRR